MIGSLRTKMIAIMLPTAVISLLCLAFVTFLYFKHQFKTFIFDEQFTMLSAKAHDIDDKIKYAQDALISVSRVVSRDTIGSSGKAQEFLDQRPGTRSIFDNGLFLFLPSGRLIAEAPFQPNRRGMDFSSYDFIWETAATKKPCISRPFISTKAHRHPVIVLAAPVVDKRKNLVAVLAGSIDLMRENFLSDIAEVKIGKSGYLYLYDRERTIIIHPDRNRILKRDVPPGANRLFDAAIKGFEGSGENVTSRGLRALSTFKALKTRDWILAANYPLAEAYEPIEKAKRYFIAILLAASIVAASTIWLTMKRLTAPLRLLTGFVDELGEKEKSRKLITVPSQDEIGALAKSFNNLLFRLWKNEEELKQSYTFTKTVLDSINDAISIIDVRDFTVVSVNKVFLEEHGLTEEAVTGKTCHEVMHRRPDVCRPPDDACPLLDTVRTGKPARVEHIHRDCNGAASYIEVSTSPLRDREGKIVSVVHATRDVTERKRSEQTAREQYLFLQLLIDTIPHPIFYKDVEGKFLGCNKSYAEFYDLVGKSIIGKTVYDIAPPAIADRYRKKDLDLFNHPGVQVSEEAIQNAGLHRDVIVTKATYTKIDGTLAGLIGVITDITDRKKLEEQLHQAQEAEKSILTKKNRELEKAYREIKTAQLQIFQREKMASIGQLAAGVAHEINNPIAFIMSNLGSLQKYIDRLSAYVRAQESVIEDLSAQALGVDEALQRISESRRSLKIDYIVDDIRALVDESLDGAIRVKKIVQDFKSFSHVDQAERKRANINECMESTLNIVWNELKYKATVIKEYGDIPLLVCNPGQLNQVFVNLLVNAAQAIDKQGEISIKTWNDDGCIKIAITDTGCGIPPEHLVRIFEPFFTTKDVGVGTGLGLSIAYEIIKKHRGDISVESDLGKGTTFTVTLPNSAEE